MRLRFERGALRDWLSSRGAASFRLLSEPFSTPPGPFDEARERADELVRGGFAYQCYCSEQELAAMHTRQEAHGQPWRYDRRCLSLYAEHRADYEAAGRKACVRFRVPEDVAVRLKDLLRGEIELSLAGLEDFVVLEADGEASRVFARVLERVRGGVTHVVRPADWLPQTTCELLLYDALGERAPHYAHLGAGPHD